MIQLNVKFEAKNEMLQTIDKILEETLNVKTWEAGLDMFMAAHELIINSITAMSSKSSNENFLEVSVNINDNSIIIEVKDRGGGIIGSSYLNKDPLSENGRGLLIVNELTDDFTIISEEDKTVFTITKNICGG